VDNSDKQFFPPIKSQGFYNSCVSWAMGYYMMTNNFALKRGLDAKNNESNRMSATMLWNLHNAGFNIGAYPFITAFITSTFGVTTMTDYPSYELGVLPSNTAWRNAIGNKAEIFMGRTWTNLNQPSSAPGNLDSIKRHLLNGYVVSVSINPDWRLEKDSPRGKVIPQFYDGLGVGHHMTIVGYCDDFYFDINGNSVEDPGERGAFKVANSWGTMYVHNEGFIWVMYDALGITTSVPSNPSANFPHPTRNGAAYEYYLLTESRVKPVLLAEIDIETESIQGLAVEIGFSETNSSTPVLLSSFPRVQRHFLVDDFDVYSIHSRKVMALDDFNDDGDYSDAIHYNGTITLDLTNMIEQFGLHDDGEKRFYINVKHSMADSYETIIHDFRLICLSTDTVINSTQYFPATINDTSPLPILRYLDASPMSMPWIPVNSMMRANLKSFMYDFASGMFYYSGAEIETENRLFEFLPSAYMEIVKHTGTTMETESGNVHFFNRRWSLPCPYNSASWGISFEPFTSNEHIEIVLYNNETDKKILAHQFFKPVVFKF